jgi:hypothetical protein
MMTYRGNCLEQHDKANLEAPVIVPADPAKYPGVMQGWAKLVFERQEAGADKPLPLWTYAANAEAGPDPQPLPARSNLRMV